MQRLTEGPLYERARAAVEEHFETYFRERDLERTLAQYDSEAIGLGSGRGECALTPEELRSVIRRDLEGYPEPVNYSLQECELYQVSDDVVVSQVLMEFQLSSPTHRMVLREGRHTLVWRFPPDAPARICHVHVSFPTDLHGDEEPYPLKELEEISRMVDDMITDRTRDLIDSYKKLEQMVVRDRLTGIYNRLRLNEALDRELMRANRYNTIFSVLFLDLDNYKHVNDTHGHLAGDEVLKAAATTIDNNVRETDTAGRWGGDEFMVVLPETDAWQAQRLGEKLRRRFSANRFRFDDDEELALSMSGGIAMYQGGDDMESLFARVDRALYQAKQAGRDQVVVAPEKPAS